MDRFLRKGLILFLLLIGLYPFVTYFIGEIRPYGFFRNIRDLRGENDFMWSRLREADQTKDIDILIVGSSLAYRGIDVRLFDDLGLKAFNLGSSAQTAIQSKYLIDKYLKDMNPKLVVWDVSPRFSIANSGKESLIDLVSNEGVNGDLINLLLTTKSYELTNTYVYVGLKQIFTDFDDFQEVSVIKNKTYIEGGFVEYSSSEFKSNSIKDYEYKLIDYQLNALNDAVKFISKNDIKILFVAAPINPQWYQSASNRKEVDQFIKNVVVDNNLEGYKNYNEIAISGLNYSSKFFIDNLHLKKEGVQIYNEQLLTDILKILE
ncbi:hypothetical protein KZP23_14755 [Echinicola marina]|uniref:D-alanyl-lipoteichoic acid biosynthesis protein DltD n=1 Tax=Echinicola marina TaxID=2859768 RepID=UPI001CF66669|nr:D-alanyl-lipoteichoic acid biosynthesis protein DltD [Echinicola marina]UCS91979.1 hypothetical protein KZP23_14755 [Echinicola marina]